MCSGCPKCTRPRDTWRAKGSLASAHFIFTSSQPPQEIYDRICILQADTEAWLRITERQCGAVVRTAREAGGWPRFKSRPCREPTVGARTSHTASPCLSFLICQQGMLMVSTSQGSHKDRIKDFEECLPHSKFRLSGGSENALWSN